VNSCRSTVIAAIFEDQAEREVERYAISLSQG
jgi:hypothetical protein